MLSRLISRLRLGPSPYKASKFNVGLDPAVPPLYQRLPSWWARYAWTLIACDVFMAGSAMEMTWNHWTTLVTDDPLPSPPSSSEPVQPSTHYGLRPAWQRAGLCFVHLTIGTGVGVFVALAQSRHVRLLTIVPPPVKDALAGKTARAASKNSAKVKIQTASRSKILPASESHVGGGARVFIQTASNWRTNGLSFPISACTLRAGRDASEMTLRVNGERAHWFIPLDGAFLRGEKPAIVKGSNEKSGDSLAVRSVRDAVVKEWTRWGGKKMGVWGHSGVKEREVDPRWRSGPVAQGGR